MAKSSRKGGISLLFIVLVLIIGYATNPSEKKFREHIKQEINERAENENLVTENVLKIFSGALSDLAPVERKNYYVLSVYRIEAGDKEYVFLGAFNHFYQFSE